MNLFANFKGVTCFSKKDLDSAYQQLELDEASKKLVTIATHMGLFASNQLCYGVTPAPGLFQNSKMFLRTLVI